MPLLDWTDSMNIGIASIDRQHKKLASLINDLNEAVVAGKGDQVYDALFNELVDYFSTHFSTEEGLMIEHDFPDYETHRFLHQGFISKVRELRSMANSGEKRVSEEALHYLVDWLVHHDLSIDKELGKFLAVNHVK